jgi:hypothetical protein
LGEVLIRNVELEIRNLRRIKTVICVFILLTLGMNYCFSQSSKFNFGGTAGLTFTFGTQVNRIGLTAKGFAVYNQLQLNTSASIFHNFRTFGIKKGGWEHQESIGAIFGFGESELENFDALIEILGNQTKRKNSIGYAYNFYTDENRMNQKTATISIQLNRLFFLTENDAFSFFANDRYRTAAATFRYRIDELTYFSIQSTLWTGDPFYQTIQPIYRNYPNPSGYEDMTGSRFTENSHGILAAQIIRLLPYQQQISMNIGIDAEQVRHTLQNRFIHDLPFIPKSLNPPRQPHIPMVASDGKPYLYQAGQTIRPSRFWFNLNMNAPTFY